MEKSAMDTVTGIRLSIFQWIYFIVQTKLSGGREDYKCKCLLEKVNKSKVITKNRVGKKKKKKKTDLGQVINK